MSPAPSESEPEPASQNPALIRLLFKKSIKVEHNLDRSFNWPVFIGYYLLPCPVRRRGRILSTMSTQMRENKTRETGSSVKRSYLMPASTWTCTIIIRSEGCWEKKVLGAKSLLASHEKIELEDWQWVLDVSPKTVRTPLETGNAHLKTTGLVILTRLKLAVIQLHSHSTVYNTPSLG